MVGFHLAKHALGVFLSERREERSGLCIYTCMYVLGRYILELLQKTRTSLVGGAA